jgi:hypothetical protein
VPKCTWIYTSLFLYVTGNFQIFLILLNSGCLCTKFQCTCAPVKYRVRKIIVHTYISEDTLHLKLEFLLNKPINELTTFNGHRESVVTNIWPQGLAADSLLEDQCRQTSERPKNRISTKKRTNDSESPNTDIRYDYNTTQDKTKIHQYFMCITQGIVMPAIITTKKQMQDLLISM